MIQRAAEEQSTLLRHKGFQVVKFKCDAGAALAALRLPGITTDSAGGGGREPVCERATRVVRERSRAVQADLTYEVPRRFVIFLLFYVILRINAMQRESGMYGITPREALRGRKLSAKYDLKTTFGQLCMVHIRVNPSAPKVNAHAGHAIALLPKENDQGSWLFWSIQSNKTISSNNFEEVPMTVEIEQVLKAWHQADKLVQPPDAVLNPINNDLGPHQEEVVEQEEQDDRYVEIIAQEPVVEVMPGDPEGNPEDWGSENVPGDGLDSVEFGPPELEGSDCDPHAALCYHLSVKRCVAEYGSDPTAAAITSEMEQMLTKGVMEPMTMAEVPPELRSKVLRTFMFMKPKIEEGQLQKIKARFVAMGNTQHLHDMVNIASPTVLTDYLKIFLSLHLDGDDDEPRALAVVDIEGAFLATSTGDELVHVLLTGAEAATMARLDPKFKGVMDSKGRIVARLKKWLYGCRQSPARFNEYLTTVMVGLGYTQNPRDPCIYRKMYRGIKVRLAFHVDDGLISGPARFMDEIIAEIEAKLPLGKVQTGNRLIYLGMRICVSPGAITLDMIDYTRECVKFFGDVPKFKTPAGANLFEVDADCRELDIPSKGVFHTGTAKLLYLSTRTRADIVLPVNVLCSRVVKPNESDWHKLCRVFGYLAEALCYGLKFCKPGKTTTIEGWADASFMSHSDTTSRTGGVIKVNGTVVSAISTKQKLVTKSSTESELVALGEIVCSVLSMREFLEFEEVVLPPTPINEDNKACLDLVRAGKSTSSRTRHIKMRHFFIKQHTDSGEIVLQWCETALMLADFLTKPLQGALFLEMRDDLVSVIMW